MPLVRKIRKAGNSVAFPVPNEIFEFLEFNPKSEKYKLIQDETGDVFLIVLGSDVIAIDEKKFQKLGSLYGFIIPKPLCTLWRVGFNDNETKEIEISYDTSPRKWLIRPVY